MTEQEIYDTIIIHLRKQGHKSLLDKPVVMFGRRLAVTCAYRGKDGDKCAAGILIPDLDYTSKMEGIAWRDIVRWLSNASEVREHASLIVDLQQIHDNYEIEGWEEAFKNLATVRQLTYTPPQATP